MVEKKKKAGRPPLENSRDSRLEMRVSRDELKKISQAAKTKGQGASTFAREGALEKAAKILKDK